MLQRAAARKTGAHAHCYGAVRPGEGRGGIEEGGEGGGPAGRIVWNWERSSVGFLGRMVEKIDAGMVGCELLCYLNEVAQAKSFFRPMLHTGGRCCCHLNTFYCKYMLCDMSRPHCLGDHGAFVQEPCAFMEFHLSVGVSLGMFWTECCCLISH